MNFCKCAFSRMGVTASAATLLLTSAAFAGPLMNQLGYVPEAEKQVVYPGSDANGLEVRDMNGKTVLKLDAPMVYEWDYSGEEVQTFDISAVKTPGTYRLFRGGEYVGTPIVVGKNVYADLVKASLKWFYYQRSSMALEPQYAGKWARAAGHMDDHVIIYGTDKVTGGKGAGKTIKSARGWYDAGDYGKYIVNSGITVWTLLEIYENFPKYADSLTWNIPREFPKYPELLEEVRYNLDWMLTMQDKDGGVYHKVSTLRFSGSVLPENDKDARYAIIKNLTATLDFAGVMAQASVVYRNIDKAYADKMLKAAEKAYAWAKKNPTAFYKQPADVQTGSYAPGNEDGKDEFRWAAAELFRATKKKNYQDDLKGNAFTANGAWWGDLNMLAAIRVALDSADFDKDLVAEAKKVVLNEANNLRAVGDTSAYRLPAFPWSWNWGSNSAMANNGMVLVHAYLLTGDKSYVDGAQQCLDYLLGKNPMDITYVTGFGYRSPRNPHHRPSESDMVDDPVPGMLVGGPHLGKQDINLDGKEHWKCPNYAAADKPALAYIDNRCSYATNEVAINWNAPLAYLAAALEAIYNK
ncbi:glycoside hydrolase family 9 protein [Fibrobacter sp.]|uniref:glycoside hydrolase family 9 protein n=1 Tax=Fibrobacter sp. TaxID=35828 RepID=UPI003890DAAC